MEQTDRESIYTCYTGKNDLLIQKVSDMYLKEGQKIADVTWGKGAFWKKVDLTKFDFHPSDLKDGIDFRDLPYENDSFDVFVLDPPYMHGSGSIHPNINKVYNNNGSIVDIKSHSDVIQLYLDGMKEAYRILRKNGMLLVKCQDEIESGKQKWSHIEIFNDAVSLGFYPKDLFVLQQDVKPMLQNKNQKHARKNHSYLWIFLKTK